MCIRDRSQWQWEYRRRRRNESDNPADTLLVWGGSCFTCYDSAGSGFPLRLYVFFEHPRLFLRPVLF